MEPKTVNLVRGGLTSEYFLACFLKGPASGYRLGQIVQNRKKPNTKTLHTATTILKNAGYITRDDNDKFQINSEKLVKVIEDEFLRKNRVTLSAKEKKIIVDILGNKVPFPFASDQMISKIHNQEFRFHNIDALEMICDKLGEFAAYFLIARRTTPNPSMKSISTDELQQTLNLLGPMWSQIGPKLGNAIQWTKDESRAFKKYTKKFPYEKSFEQFPDSQIIKEAFTDLVKNQKTLKQKKEKTESDKNSILLMKKFADYMQAMTSTLPATKAFVELPEETMIKLCSLWNQGYGFLFAWQTLSKK